MDKEDLLESLKPKQVFTDDFNSLSMRKTLWEEIENLMKRTHCNSTVFCNKTELNKTILSNLKKEDHRPDKKTIVSICIGLKLEYIEAEQLLALAGYKLILTRRIEYAYYLFMTRHKYSEFEISDYNYLLECWGFDKKHCLGSQDRTKK